MRRSAIRRSNGKTPLRPAAARTGSRLSAYLRSAQARRSLSPRLSGPRGSNKSLKTITPSSRVGMWVVILLHPMVERAQLLIKAAFRLPTFQLVAGPEVDEARVAGEPGVDLGDPAEHLLRDPPVVGVALRRGPELTQVIDLAEVHPEVPADSKSERHYVLGQSRAGIALQPRVDSRRSFDSGGKTPAQAEVGNSWREVVAEARAQHLAILREHAVAVQVAVRAEVGDDLERVLGVLEGARHAVTAVGAIAQQSLEDPGVIHGLEV